MRQSRDSSSSSASARGQVTPRASNMTSRLSLKELNDRLEKYIASIEMLPESPHHTITRVTERTGGSVDFTSMHEYREYEQLLKDYLAEEQEIANMEADIKEFEYKNGYWLKCNEEVDGQLREMERMISEKRSHISQLEEKVRVIEMERQQLEYSKREREKQLLELQTKMDELPAGWKEKIATIEMNSVRASINEDRKTFMSRLSQVEYDESTVTQEVDIAALRKEIAAEYEKRLKDELQKMQCLYNDHISGVKIEVQKLYSIKKEELDRMMRSLSGDSKANIDKILEEFRNAKKEIIRLENEKMELTQRERELAEQLEEDRIKHMAMIKAKREEVAFLQSEYESFSVKITHFEGQKASYDSEVRRFESIIRPAEQRITLHAEPFIDHTVKEKKLKLKFQQLLQFQRGGRG